MRAFAAAVALGVLAFGSIGQAQEAPEADYDEIQATIDRMQRRIEKMGEAASSVTTCWSSSRSRSIAQPAG